MTYFEKIVEENKLTVDENNKILILPTDKYSFTTYPLPKDKSMCLKVSFEEYLGLIDNKFMFNDELNKIINYIE